MTGLQLVNEWYREGRLSPSLYELLIRRLTHPPFSAHSLNIVDIPADQLKEIIVNGKIGQVRGVGARWLSELKNIVELHHPVMYMDAEQLMRWGEYDQKGIEVSFPN